MKKELRAIVYDDKTAFNLRPIHEMVMNNNPDFKKENLLFLSFNSDTKLWASI